MTQVAKKEGFYTTCLLGRFPGDWMWIMRLDLQEEIRRGNLDAQAHHVGGMCDWLCLPRTEGMGRISSGAPATSYPCEPQCGKQGYS